MFTPKFNKNSISFILFIMCGLSISILVFVAMRTSSAFDKITIGNDKYRHFITIVNKQRVFSQKIVLLSERFSETNDMEDLKNVKITLQHMKDDYDFLVKNNFSKEILAIYMEKPFYLANDLEKFFLVVEDIEKNNTLLTIKELSSILSVKLDYLTYKICAESNRDLEKVNHEKYKLIIEILIAIFLQIALFITLYKKITSDNNL